MKSKIQLAILVGLLVLFIGCKTSTDNNARQTSRTLPELVKDATTESEEFRFCIQEDAGNESLKECSERIRAIVASLPESISGSELPSDRKDKISKKIEDLQAAFDDIANAVERNSSNAEKSKANSSFNKHLQIITKLLR